VLPLFARGLHVPFFRVAGRPSALARRLPRGLLDRGPRGLSRDARHRRGRHARHRRAHGRRHRCGKRHRLRWGARCPERWRRPRWRRGWRHAPDGIGDHHLPRRRPALAEQRRGVRDHRGGPRPPHHRRHPHARRGLPRRPGPDRRHGHHQLRGLRLHRFGGRRLHALLPRWRPLSWAHQRARAPDVPGPALHRHRRALRAPPRLAAGPPRPHRDHRAGQREHQRDALGRAPHGHGRRDVDQRFGLRERLSPQPRPRQQHGGPGPAAGRLRHVPPRRQRRRPPDERLRLPDDQHHGRDLEHRGLHPAPLRGHRPRRPQRVPLRRARRLCRQRSHRAPDRADPRRGTRRRRHLRHPRGQLDAHLVAPQQRDPLRRHGARPRVPPPRRPDRPRHRLDLLRLDEPPPRALVRGRPQHGLLRRVLRGRRPLADGDPQRRPSHRDRRRARTHRDGPGRRSGDLRRKGQRRSPGRHRRPARRRGAGPSEWPPPLWRLERGRRAAGREHVRDDGRVRRGAPGVRDGRDGHGSLRAERGERLGLSSLLLRRARERALVSPAPRAHLRPAEPRGERLDDL
jgi:hypothetical protein